MKPTVKRIVATSALAALVCTAGIGAALAASAPESTAGPANVVAFHEELGLSFDDIAQAAAANATTAAEKAAATVGTREFCLSCHDWDAIVNETLLPGDVTVYNKKGLYNVHDNHNSFVDCSDCHSIDGSGTSTLGCVSCHYMELPEGWHGFY